MTVAVACNLPDGVILGVDSAVTVPTAGGVAKVYENADKLFQLGDLPIGLAAYGLGALGERGIGSYVREFEVVDPDKVLTTGRTLRTVVESLRKFFSAKYDSTVVPVIEKELGKKFKDIPSDQHPVLGLVLGGFSTGAYLSEVWEIKIPEHKRGGSARRARAQGDFGTVWFAMFEPIRRYIKGIDQQLVTELLNHVEGLRGAPFSGPQRQQIMSIVRKHEYQIPFQAMPMAEGIAHTRFLVELVINHHRFAVGAPVVGGAARIGAVTYKGEQFHIVES